MKLLNKMLLFIAFSLAPVIHAGDDEEWDIGLEGNINASKLVQNQNIGLVVTFGERDCALMRNTLTTLPISWGACPKIHGEKSTCSQCIISSENFKTGLLTLYFKDKTDEKKTYELLKQHNCTIKPLNTFCISSSMNDLSKKNRTNLTLDDLKAKLSALSLDKKSTSNDSLDSLDWESTPPSTPSDKNTLSIKRTSSCKDTVLDNVLPIEKILT